MLEARAAGRPVLAAPVDGLADQIAEGAIPVSGSSVAEWTAALNRLMTHGAAPIRAPEQTFAEDWRALVDELAPRRPA